MFGYFSDWGRLWYPDSLVSEPGFLIPLCVVGLLSFFILWLKEGCHGWLGIAALLMFLWALPALIAGVVAIVIEVLKLVLFAFFFFVVIWALFSWDFSTPEYTIKKTGKNTFEIHGPDDTSD